MGGYDKSQKAKKIEGVHSLYKLQVEKCWLSQSVLEAAPSATSPYSPPTSLMFAVGGHTQSCSSSSAATHPWVLHTKKDPSFMLKAAKERAVGASPKIAFAFVFALALTIALALFHFALFAIA
eukprot:1161716-Pelagomonas_calceolata.AAC.16